MNGVSPIIGYIKGLIKEQTYWRTLLICPAYRMDTLIISTPIRTMAALVLNLMASDLLSEFMISQGNFKYLIINTSETGKMVKINMALVTYGRWFQVKVVKRARAS